MSEYREVEKSLGAHHRFLASVTLVAGIAAPISLVIMTIAWLRIAGEAGSPQPDNWSQLSLVLTIIERSVLPLLVITGVAPFAWAAFKKGRRWVTFLVPTILAIMIAAQIGLYLKDRHDSLNAPVFTCHVPSGYLPPIDANGAALKVGDIVIIASTPDWISELLRSEQGGKINANVGRALRISSFGAGGTVNFEFPESESVRFCLFPSEVIRHE